MMVVKTLANLPQTLYSIEKYFGFKNKVKWVQCFAFLTYNILGVYWCYNYTFPVKWQTVAFAVFVAYASMMGITCGVHRLWTHKSFKATFPVKLALLISYTCTGQNSVLGWVRDHRVHHKYSDTEADPYDASRGFFFSHMGWFLTKKNKEVVRRGNEVDLSDITGDPLLLWHHKNFLVLKLLFCFILPTATGIWLWNEDWKCAIAWQNFIRFFIVLHGEFSINSLAHYYGYKPYNKNIQPSENWFVSIATLGEGWHNYHHAFPFDYKAAETCDFINLSAKLLRFLARIGLVYDLREATPNMYKSMAKRQGDGTPIRADREEVSVNETSDCE